MPIAISKLLKRDVFATQEGLRLGRAQDVLIDRDEHRIALVVLSMRGVAQTATVMKADDVHLVGGRHVAHRQREGDASGT